MKLASFTLNGRPAWGPVVDGGVIDATSQFPTLKAALAADGVAKVAAWAAGRKADAALDAIAFLPTIPDPGKVWCCARGGNRGADRAHRAARTDGAGR